MSVVRGGWRSAAAAAALRQQQPPRAWPSILLRSQCALEHARLLWTASGSTSWTLYARAAPLSAASKFSNGRHLTPAARFANKAGGGGRKTIKVPEMGESITEGAIASWVKKKGDSVVADEIICQIETDKVTVDIRAPSAGVITEELANEGDTVSVGQDLIEMDVKEESGKEKAAATPVENDGGEAQPPEEPVATSRSSEASTKKSEASKKKSDGAGEGTSSGQIVVPEIGESIKEGTMVSWMVHDGDVVAEDQVIGEIETDKITVDVRAPQAGVIEKILVDVGTTVSVGQPIVDVKYGVDNAVADVVKPEAVDSAEERAASPSKKAEAAPESAPSSPPPPPSSVSQGDGNDDGLEDVTKQLEHLGKIQSGERRVAMTRMRKRIAERLKEAQNIAAILTTFNEVDMSGLSNLREDYKDTFLKKHSVKLGFMSAFVKEQPEVNAFIDGGDIVYRDYVDISVAVSTPTGLVVPAIRGCESLSFADVEKTINSLGEKAKTGSLTLNDLQGGTFTISNGGVFGSLLSTPIINMPQSAILGMHAIQKRPVVVDNQIVIRPMMYLALSYDHRLIDGKEAVTFLRRVKTMIEDPRRLLLDINL